MRFEREFYVRDDMPRDIANQDIERAEKDFRRETFARAGNYVAEHGPHVVDFNFSRIDKPKGRYRVYVFTSHVTLIPCPRSTHEALAR